MKNELWLEIGYVQDRDQTSMSWYNEGNWQELPYFMKRIWKRLTGKDAGKRYFLARYGKLKILFNL